MPHFLMQICLIIMELKYTKIKPQCTDRGRLCIHLDAREPRRQGCKWVRQLARHACPAGCRNHRGGGGDGRDGGAAEHAKFLLIKIHERRRIKNIYAYYTAESRQ
jgi:hypothetical protein